MGLLDFLFGKKKPAQIPGTGKQQETVVTNFKEKIEIEPGIIISKVFVAHWTRIQETRLPCISITATPSSNLLLEQSKFGHYPYMPAEAEYPTDAQGNWMYPLAQLHCKEMPQLPGYPESGYLQFYISATDELYGLDFDNPQSQKNFRVLYFEEHEIKNHKVDFSFLDEVMESGLSPVEQPHALRFLLKDNYIGEGDFRYEDNPDFKVTDITGLYPDIQSNLEEELYDLFSPNGHKAGGYAYFTQWDPRSGRDQFKEYVLLLQIDSDNSIMWGDVGVANFFIHPDDLAKKDFSRVLYNWDCC